MKKYLVIGNPIEHSLSPLIHNYWFKKYEIKDSFYEKKKIEEKELPLICEKIKKEELAGANITLPFKKSIIPFLDIIETSAKETQSVNTIFKKNGKVIGRPSAPLVRNDGSLLLSDDKANVIYQVTYKN